MPDHTGQEHDRAAHGDFSAGTCAEPPVHERQTFERPVPVLAAARQAGFSVTTACLISGPVIPRFRPAQPAKPQRATEPCCRADPALLIHPAVAPREGEPVIAKHRTSAFLRQRV